MRLNEKETKKDREKAMVVATTALCMSAKRKSRVGETRPSTHIMNDEEHKSFKAKKYLYSVCFRMVKSMKRNH